MIDGAQFSGGQTFEELQKLGLARKSGNALPQSLGVAELAKKVAINEYEDPRRTAAAKEARRANDGRRRHSKIRKKAEQLEKLLTEAVDVRTLEHSPKKKRRLLPWSIGRKRPAQAAKKANGQDAMGKRRSSSVTSIEVEETENEVAVYFNEIQRHNEQILLHCTPPEYFEIYLGIFYLLLPSFEPLGSLPG